MSYSEMQIHEISQTQLMEDAKSSLSGRWGLAVGTVVGVTLISALSVIIPFANFLIAGPISLGFSMFFLRLARGQEAEFGNVFDGFKHFGAALGAYLLMLIGVLVGMIFLIVPGIIIALGLSQTMFILADEPELGAVEALKKSWAMMDGHKIDYFVLGIRFIPWMILCIFTLFIGFFWLAPYMQVTFANFYDALRTAQNPDEDFGADDISRHLVEE